MNKSTLVDKFGKPLANSNFYRATNASRDRRYIPAVATDSSQTLNGGTRKQLMGLSRFLYSNSGICRAACNELSRNAVGSGLRPQSQADPERAKEYESYFEQWSQIADVTGRFSFDQMQYIMSLRADIDGDILLAFTTTDTGFPALQLIEAHRIDSDWQDPDYIDGVRTDKWGKVVAYQVKEGDKFRKIAAKDCILFMDADRADQTRAATSLSTAINNIANIEDLIHFETVGVKMNSAVGIWIGSESGEVDSGSSFIESGNSASDTGSLGIDTFSAGMIPRMREGESINSFASSKGTPTFPHFITHLVRNLSVGLNLPMEWIWDASGLTGVSTRMVIKKADRTFKYRQQLLTNKVLKRVWAWVIAKGIKRGDLEHDPSWWKCRWIADKSLSVDLGRDSTAMINELKMGIQTMEQIAAENGGDWRDVREQLEKESNDLIERAKAMAQAQDVSLELCLDLLSARTSSPNLDPSVSEE